MKRSILALVLLCIPSTTFAQGGLSIMVFEIEGRSSSNLTLPISRAECESNVMVTFQVTGIPTASTNLRQLDFWSSGGTNCNDVSERTAPKLTCTYLPSPVSQAIENPGVTQQQKLDPIPIQSLLVGTQGASGDGGAAGGPVDCATLNLNNASPSVFVLATQQAGSVEDVGSNWGKVPDTFRIDTVAPGAPSDPSDESGESEVTVTWDAASEAQATYVVYVDTEASSCDAPSSGFEQGAPAPAEGGAGADSTSKSLDPSKYMDEGESRPYFVATKDIAGNIGVLSEAGCIRYVPTEGFWDKYKSAKGDGDVDTGCRALSAASGTPLAVTFVGLGVFLWFRRRRK